MIVHESILPKVVSPFVCMYYLTDWCNAKCSFCNIWQNPAYRPSELQRVRRDIADLKRLHIQFIDFTGGEPFMRRELPEIFGFAEEYGIRYGFTNNGSLFERNWSRIQHLRPYSLSFSLDSPDAEYHNQHRQLPDNFSQILRSIKLCHSVGWRPSIIFTPTSETYSHLEAMIRLGEELGVVIVLNPVFSYKDVGGSLSPSQLLSLMEYARHDYVTVNPIYIQFLLEGGNKIDDPTCRSMNTHVVVAPDSSLYTPCYHYSQFRMPTPDGIYAAVRSPQWRMLSEKAGRYEFCRGCTINCYMAEGLALRHPIQSIALLASHLIKRGTELVSRVG